MVKRIAAGPVDELYVRKRDLSAVVVDGGALELLVVVLDVPLARQADQGGDARLLRLVGPRRAAQQPVLADLVGAGDVGQRVIKDRK